MSLVPYSPYPVATLDETNQDYLALMAFCVVGATVMAAVNSVKDRVSASSTTDAEVQTEEPTTCTDIILRLLLFLWSNKRASPPRKK